MSPESGDPSVSALRWRFSPPWRCGSGGRRAGADGRAAAALAGQSRHLGDRQRGGAAVRPTPRSALRWPRPRTAGAVSSARPAVLGRDGLGRDRARPHDLRASTSSSITCRGCGGCTACTTPTSTSTSPPGCRFHPLEILVVAGDQDGGGRGARRAGRGGGGVRSAAQRDVDVQPQQRVGCRRGSRRSRAGSW